MYAASPYSHARSYGINSLVIAFHGDFCPFARNTCGFLYGDKSVGYFGHLTFEQTNQKFGSGSAQINLGIVVGILHTVNNSSDGLSFAEEIAGNLLTFGKKHFVALIVHNEHFVFPNLIYFAAHNFAHAVFIFVV